MYRVTILADSKDPRGNRLTTFELVFPRIILPQFSKHRMFSFNTSSSRAVPFEKVLKSVQESPFIPLAWQKHHSGMQGTEYITEESVVDFKKGVWLHARNKAIQSAEELYYPVSRARSINDIEELKGTGVTKQLCNRLLEPFMWVKVIMTTSEEGLQNFFELRCPDFDGFKSRKEWLKHNPEFMYAENDDMFFHSINKGQAEIPMGALAEAMYDAYNESTPEELESGWWHIPYLNEINKVADEVGALLGKEAHFLTSTLVAVSSALAARVSYTTIGSDFDIDHERLLKLHDRLVEDRHLSCFEHTSRVMTDEEYKTFVKGRVPLFDPKGLTAIPLETQGYCANFRGFIPYRYMIENEEEL